MLWPGWSPHDVLAQSARLECVIAPECGCVSQRAAACMGFVSLSPRVHVHVCVCVQSGLCARLYVYVCVCSRLLPPTG